MKNQILIALFSLGFATLGQAMPSGTFECSSPDLKNQAKFEISNYGTHHLRSTWELKIEGLAIDLKSQKDLISRQWIDDKKALIDVGIPGDDVFSKALVIEAKAVGAHTQVYKGTARIEVQENDYTDRIKVIARFPIECNWNP